MTDRDVSMSGVVAYSVWALAAVILCGAAAFDRPGLAWVGLLILGVAMTATVRLYFVQQNREMRAALALVREDRSVSSIR